MFGDFQAVVFLSHSLCLRSEVRDGDLTVQAIHVFTSVFINRLELLNPHSADSPTSSTHNLWLATVSCQIPSHQRS